MSHSSIHSGLQQHSIGPLYPWAVQWLGIPGRSLRAQAVNLITGETCKTRPNWTSFGYAYEMAEVDAKLRRAGYKECPDCGLLYNSDAQADDCCTLPEHWQA